MNGVLIRTVKIITWIPRRKIQRDQHQARKDYELHEEELGLTVPIICVWLTVASISRKLRTPTMVFGVSQGYLNHLLS